MTRDAQVDAQLAKYSLTPNPKLAEEIREIIRREIADENRDDNEILKLSCSQLFSIGSAEDSLLIWRAKQSDFDASCYLDIQLLCGAGLEETKAFLSNLDMPEAEEALEHLLNCEKSGDFNEFTVESQNREHHRYFYGS
jgi:intergrase/recombinase